MRLPIQSSVNLTVFDHRGFVPPPPFPYRGFVPPTGKFNPGHLTPHLTGTPLAFNPTDHRGFIREVAASSTISQTSLRKFRPHHPARPQHVIKNFANIFRIILETSFEKI